MATHREKDLEYIIRECIWMARRYALNRHTYAPSIVNKCLSMCELLGIEIEDDETLVQDGNSSTKYLDEK